MKGDSVCHLWSLAVLAPTLSNVIGCSDRTIVSGQSSPQLSGSGINWIVATEDVLNAALYFVIHPILREEIMYYGCMQVCQILVLRDCRITF